MVHAGLGPTAIALLVAACTWPATDALQTAVVVNQTEREIVVFLDYPTGETSIMELAPGESHTENFSAPADPCAPATLVARDSSGVEVDRMEPPFCVGETWEILDSN